MKRRIGWTAIALAAACLAGATTAAAGETKRPRDPWVFRSVLDGRARMLTCAMHDKLYVSYDTQTGSLYRAWAGRVNFTGGVYDARHGPQPTSVGPAYFRRDKHEPAWGVTVDGKPTDAKPHYLGYATGKNGDEVTIELAFDTPGGRVNIDEMPSCDVADDKITLVRTFKVAGLPAGTAITLDLAGEDGDPTAEHAIDAPGNPSARPPTTAPSDLRLDRNGTVTLRTTWRTR